MILEELVTLAPYNPPAAFTVRSRRTRIHVQSYRHLRLYCNTEQREREKEREGGGDDGSHSAAIRRAQRKREQGKMERWLKEWEKG